MALSHLHLVLNHVPVIGAVIAFGLLLLALLRRSDDLRHAGLEVLVLVGLFTLPAYLTGVGGQRDVANRPDVLIAAVRAHHDAALLGGLSMLLTALLAWVGLWQTRRNGRPAASVFGGVVLLTILTVALMGRAANLGGLIRHPEVTSLQAQAADAGWMTASIARVANFELWAWPMAEVFHFIGMWMLFGILLAANLRMLGVMKVASFRALHGLLPFAVLGLTFNIVTGMIFVIALPGQYAGWAFYWKMVLLMVAAGNLLYLTIADAPWSVGAGSDAPLLARTLAGTGIASWLLVMYLGRMLPYLGNSF